MTLRPDILENRFKDITKSDGCETSNANTTTKCFLLDQNGYVLSPTASLGSFVGEESRFIVDILVKNEVLKEIMLYDTQGECVENYTQRGSAHSLLAPAKLIMRGTTYVVGAGLRAGVFFTAVLMSRWGGWVGDGSWGGAGVGANTPTKIGIKESCKKKMQFYLFDHEAVARYAKLSATKKTQSCDKKNCTLSVPVVESVPGTNMMFVKVTVSPRECSKCWLSYDDKFGTYVPSPSVCEMDARRNETFERRPPSRCAKMEGSTAGKVVNTPCGGGSMVMPLTLVGVLMATWVSVVVGADVV